MHDILAHRSRGIGEIAYDLRQGSIRSHSNDCITGGLKPGDIEIIQAEVEQCARALLDALLIDQDNDPNAIDTAKRLARMWVREVFVGRYTPAPAITDFPNAKRLDEIYTVGPVIVRSACSHHFYPVEGKAWLGVIPGKRIIGLSKFSRLARWVFARPQIQEEAAVQLADLLEEMIEPRGLAVIIRAKHSCMTWRGVQENGTTMTTSVMRGAMRDNATARSEFLALIGGQEFMD